MVSPNASVAQRGQAVVPGWSPYMVLESGFRPAQPCPKLSLRVVKIAFVSVFKKSVRRYILPGGVNVMMSWWSDGYNTRPDSKRLGFDSPLRQ